MVEKRMKEVRICGVLIGTAAAVSLQGYRMSFAGFKPEVESFLKLTPKAKVEGTYDFSTGEFEIFVDGVKRKVQTEFVQFIYTNPNDARATVIDAMRNTSVPENFGAKKPALVAPVKAVAKSGMSRMGSGSLTKKKKKRKVA